MRAATTRTMAWLALGSAALAAGCRDLQSPGPSEIAGPQFITNGVPTGTAYPNVGAVLFDFDGNRAIAGDEAFCSGSLIGRTVFLTAAHCLAWLPPGAQLYVSFDPALLPGPPNVIRAKGFHIDPAYGQDPADLHDLAVIILPRGSARRLPPLRLPPEGLLDELAAQGALRDQLFVNVGYGVSATLRGMPAFDFDGARKVSKSLFMALQPNWLGLLMNEAATGEGGDCFGDSGSPKFFEGDESMIVATVTWGDAVCRATSWDYRLDTPSARGFLGRFVSLP